MKNRIRSDYSVSLLADMIGKSISHYRIIEKLGGGGMGIVYKARDTLLGRLVALKVVSAELLRDQDAVASFVREAKAASALNHPNILTVHDLVEAEGSRFIVMELVEGQTLRQLIGKGGIKLKRLVTIGGEVAEALSAAHKARIVHRDLKPENIMVRADEHVKVVDFGLAKLLKRTRALTASGVPVDSTLPLPAVPSASTDDTGRESHLAGTLPYMSPEQLSGRAIDQRTDIFSFGVVLYEMATGQQPVQGRTTSEVIEAILQKEPRPIKEGSRDVPERLQDLVTKCLEKDPADRYQHMDDVVVDLRKLRRTSESGKTIGIVPAMAPRMASRMTALLSYGLAGALLLTTALSVWVLWPPPPPAPQILATWEREIGNATASPDGKMIAFDSDTTGQREIYVMHSGSGNANQITQGPGDKSDPRFSPDGRQIMYSVSGEVNEIWIDSPSGGKGHMFLSNALSADWSPDGKEIAYARQASGQPASLWLSDLSGHDIASFYTSLFEPMSDVRWSPDGKWIFLNSVEGPRIISPEGKGPMDLKDKIQTSVGSVAWSSDGISLYYSKREKGIVNIWKLPVEQGDPERVTDGAGQDFNPMPLQDGKTLEYTSGRFDQAIQVYSIKDKQAYELLLGGWLSAPTISPDQRQVAYLKGEPDEDFGDIWKSGVDGQSQSQLGQDMHSYNVIWSPEGNELAYSAEVGPEIPHRYHVFVTPLAKHEGRQITAGNSDDYMSSWSPDGEKILFTRILEGKSTLVELDLKSRKETQIGQDYDGGDYSADGQWILAEAAGSDPERRGVWVFPSHGGPGVRVIPEPVGSAQWALRGRAVIFSSASPRKRRVQIWKLNMSNGRPQGQPSLFLEFAGPSTSREEWEVSDDLSLAVYPQARVEANFYKMRLPH